VLVLTRRANQSIMIGDDIVVTVLDVRGDQVRIGIKAPRSVDVHREEVFVALQREAIRDASDAIQSSPDDVIDLVDAGVVEIVVARPGE
jgi:carbon storage regulator